MKGIITADWHLCGTPPICRKETEDEWFELQKECIAEIFNTAKKYECPIYIVGDIFDRAIVAKRIEVMLLQLINIFWDIPVNTIAGNHDLPYHNYTLVNKSSYGILETKTNSLCNIKNKIWANHFGLDHIIVPEKLQAEIVFTHQLVSPTPLPGAKTPEEIKEQFPNAKYIFTGDNHTAFHYPGNTQLFNPGCINRQAADFKEYQPKILFIDTELNEAKWIELYTDIKIGHVTDEHIEIQKARDDRINSFIEKIKSKKEQTFDFRSNLLEKVEALPDNEKAVKLQVLKILEGVK